jgi:CRISPR/Cas system-associated endonuclease Cas1
MVKETRQQYYLREYGIDITETSKPERIKTKSEIIADIKEGSYNGIFYGIEGSWARKYYQPLLNWFLMKETGNKMLADQQKRSSK